MKRIFIVLCMISLLPAMVWAQSQVIYQGDQFIGMEGTAKLVQDRTFIPLFALDKVAGFTGSWDESSHTVTIAGKEEPSLVMRVDKMEAVRGERTLKMDVAPFVDDGRVFVPLRFVLEAFDYGVMWEKDENAVCIAQKPLERRVDQSSKWNESVIQAAMDVVFTKFSQWNVMGEMLAYEKEYAKQQAVMYVNHGMGSTDGTKVDEVLVLKSRFRTPKGAEGAWNPGDEYTWSFTFVVREGNLELKDWGY